MPPPPPFPPTNSTASTSSSSSSTLLSHPTSRKRSKSVWKKPRLWAGLLIVVVVGAGLALLELNLSQKWDDDLAESAFLNNVVGSFKDAETTLVLSGSAFAAMATTTRVGVPSPSEFQLLYNSFLVDGETSQLGVIRSLQRVPNNDEGFAQFEANATARFGFNVTVEGSSLPAGWLGNSTFSGLDNLYVFRDGAPFLPSAFPNARDPQVVIGRVVAYSDPTIYAFFDAVLAENTTSNPFDSLVLVSDWIRPDTPKIRWGVRIAPDHALLINVDFSESLSLVLDTPHVGMSIFSQSGTEVSLGTCAVKNAAFRVRLPLKLTKTVSFSVLLGVCDEFKDDFSGSSKWWAFAAIVVATLTAAVAWVVFVLITDRQKVRDIMRERLLSTQDAHSRLVAYVCHELRNPLHVMNTWFPVLKDEAEAEYLQHSSSSHSSTSTGSNSSHQPLSSAAPKPPHSDLAVARPSSGAAGAGDAGAGDAGAAGGAARGVDAGAGAAGGAAGGGDAGAGAAGGGATDAGAAGGGGATDAGAGDAGDRADAYSSSVDPSASHLASNALSAPSEPGAIPSSASRPASRSATPQADPLSHEEKRMAYDDISAALRQMTSTVNDVLDFRSLESGKFSHRPAPCDVRALSLAALRRSMPMLRPGVVFQQRLHTPFLPIVDETRLLQVLFNGISNAGKHTLPSGTVCVSVAVLSEADLRANSMTATSSRGQPIRFASLGKRGFRTPASGRYRVSGSGRAGRGHATSTRIGRTNGGTVAISVPRQESTSTEAGFVVIDISNTGVGLASIDVEHLFIPFRGQRVGELSLDREQLGWTVRRPPATLPRLQQARSVAMSLLPQPSVVPQIGPYSSVSDTASTGLGLPLCRLYAAATSGWSSIEDDASGTTHFWAVIPARLLPLTGAARQPLLNTVPDPASARASPALEISFQNSDTSTSTSASGPPRLSKTLSRSNVSALDGAGPSMSGVGNAGVSGAGASGAAPGPAPAGGGGGGVRGGRIADSGPVVPNVGPQRVSTHPQLASRHDPTPSTSLMSSMMVGGHDPARLSSGAAFPPLRSGQSKQQILPAISSMSPSESRILPLSDSNLGPGPATGPPANVPAVHKRGFGRRHSDSLPASPAESSATPSPRAVSFLDLRILVVDDDTPNIRVVRRLLSRLGFPAESIRSVESGSAALDICLPFVRIQGSVPSPEAGLPGACEGVPHTATTYKRHSRTDGSWRPDLVLCDIIMPGLTGVEVMTALRGANFPVYAMTASVDSASVARYKAAGFAGLLVKPFDVNSLKSLLVEAARQLSPGPDLRPEAAYSLPLPSRTGSFGEDHDGPRPDSNAHLLGSEEWPVFAGLTS